MSATYDEQVAACPEPGWHDTHRYCPVCPWNEVGPPDSPKWDALAAAKLTFDRLSDVNRRRASRWHPGFPGPDADWTGADWSNALAGEVGEAANVVKKLRRYECGLRGQLDPPEAELRAMLAEELADVACYLDLLATYYSVDLAAAIVAKFNKVSERQGFPERLP